MGRYLNPPEKLEEIGRRLNSNLDFNALTRELRPNELLFGLFDKLIFKIAPNLFSQREFDEFDRQYSSGYLISKAYFAVDKETAKEYGSF